MRLNTLYTKKKENKSNVKKHHNQVKEKPSTKS